MLAFHKVPDRILFPYPLVFIHGAWHDSFYWHPITDELYSSGFEIYAIDLPGHGSHAKEKSINRITFGDYLNELKDIITLIGKDVILVGHSMGGMVIQKYLTTNSCKGVVLLAPVPFFGVYKLVYSAIKKYPVVVINSLIGRNLFNLINTREKADYWLYNDTISETEKEKYFKHLQRESILAFFTLLFPGLRSLKKNKTPMLLIAAEDDRLFSVEDMQRTAKFHEADFLVISKASHNLMLSSTDEAAYKMIDWLNLHISIS